MTLSHVISLGFGFGAKILHLKKGDCLQKKSGDVSIFAINTGLPKTCCVCAHFAEKVVAIIILHSRNRHPMDTY
jgi:hypothetical protein